MRFKINDEERHNRLRHSQNKHLCRFQSNVGGGEGGGRWRKVEEGA